MSDPILTVQILDTYKSRLASITKANGYHSDAGAELYEGWLADAIADDARSNYPFIALQPGVDRRLSKSSGGRLRRQLELHVVVVDRVDDGITTPWLTATTWITSMVWPLIPRSVTSNTTFPKAAGEWPGPLSPSPLTTS